VVSCQGAELLSQLNNPYPVTPLTASQTGWEQAMKKVPSSKNNKTDSQE